MEDKTRIYARMLSDDLGPKEIEALKISGEWDEITRIVSLIDDVELPALDKKTHLDLVKVENAKRKPKARSLNVWWKISAATSVILLLGLFLFQQSKQTTVDALYAATKTVQLPDDSQIVLNDGSQISFSESKWNDKRFVVLKGEAWFKVRKGSSFTVETDEGLVEVLGTEFNVNAWDGNLTVECYSGKVKVSSDDETFILTKGNRVRFSKNGKGALENHLNNSPTWKRKISSFYEDNINNVFNEMERQFNVNINVPSMDKIFTGIFTHSSINQALHEVCSPLGLEFEINDVTKIITISR